MQSEIDTKSKRKCVAKSIIYRGVDGFAAFNACSDSVIFRLVRIEVIVEQNEDYVCFFRWLSNNLQISADKVIDFLFYRLTVHTLFIYRFAAFPSFFLLLLNSYIFVLVAILVLPKRNF